MHKGYKWNHKGYKWNHKGYKWNHKGYKWNLTFFNKSHNKLIKKELQLKNDTLKNA